MTDFEFIDSINLNKDKISKEDLIQMEVAFQLKRIADSLDEIVCDGSLSTFESNKKLEKVD